MTSAEEVQRYKGSHGCYTCTYNSQKVVDGSLCRTVGSLMNTAPRGEAQSAGVPNHNKYCLATSGRPYVTVQSKDPPSPDQFLSYRLHNRTKRLMLIMVLTGGFAVTQADHLNYSCGPHMTTAMFPVLDRAVPAYCPAPAPMPKVQEMTDRLRSMQTTRSQ
eukprot:gene4084-741_t